MLGARWRQWKNSWMDYPLRQGVVLAGNYRVEQPLGMGSYGQAYRCTDLSTGDAVLLKRGKPSKRGIGLTMLQHESKVMQSLRHPQIPGWLDEFRHRNETMLVMQFVPGYNLERSIMELNHTYTEREALGIVSQVLHPLKYMHTAGYVHRDVRTPNVMLHGGSAWLIDFGLSCRIGEEQPDEWRRAELAGERVEEPAGFADGWGAVKHRMRKPEPASDLLGLGHLFLFLMYAGYVPQEGQEERSWEEELELHPIVKGFVSGLLEGKWETAEECERELARIMDELP